MIQWLIPPLVSSSAPTPPRPPPPPFLPISGTASVIWSSRGRCWRFIKVDRWTQELGILGNPFHSMEIDVTISPLWQSPFFFPWSVVFKLDFHPWFYYTQTLVNSRVFNRQLKGYVRYDVMPEFIFISWGFFSLRLFSTRGIFSLFFNTLYQITNTGSVDLT